MLLNVFDAAHGSITTLGYRSAQIFGAAIVLFSTNAILLPKAFGQGEWSQCVAWNNGIKYNIVNGQHRNDVCFKLARECTGNPDVKATYYDSPVLVETPYERCTNTAIGSRPTPESQPQRGDGGGSSSSSKGLTGPCGGSVTCYAHPPDTAPTWGPVTITCDEDKIPVYRPHPFKCKCVEDESCFADEPGPILDHTSDPDSFFVFRVCNDSDSWAELTVAGQKRFSARPFSPELVDGWFLLAPHSPCAEIGQYRKGTAIKYAAHRPGIWSGSDRWKMDSKSPVLNAKLQQQLICVNTKRAFSHLSKNACGSDEVPIHFYVDPYTAGYEAYTLHLRNSGGTLVGDIELDTRMRSKPEHNFPIHAPAPAAVVVHPVPHPLPSLEYFTFRVCNQSGKSAEVAVLGRKTSNDQYTAEGWWIIDPGQCSEIGRYHKGRFYYMAVASGDWNTKWTGNQPACVTTERFSKVVKVVDAQSCLAGETLVGFMEAQISDNVHTWSLDRWPPPPPPVEPLRDSRTIYW